MTDDPHQRRRSAEEYSTLVNALTTIIADAIVGSGASYPASKHVLSRVLGALVAANTTSDSEQDKAIAMLGKAIKGAAAMPDLAVELGFMARKTH
jgi:hypothetical protein